MTTDLQDRILGCLLGLAIGDALGMPSSFLPPQEIQRIYGKIIGFEEPLPDHIYHAGYKAGQVTDDTEQTLFVAEALLESKKVDSENIARYLLKWYEMVGGAESNAVGPSTKAALERISRGENLELAGRRGDTNGAAMRISPVGILHSAIQSRITRIVKDVYRVCLPTHGSNLAVSGASALACGIAAALQKKTIAEIITATVEGAQMGYKHGFPVIGPSIARRIHLGIEIVNSSSNLEDASDQIYHTIGAGVAIAESVPAAIALFYASEGDPIAGMLAAANMGGDTDTVASMTGALAGACTGSSVFPDDWVNTIEEVNQLDLRTRSQKLYAASLWWNG